MAAKLIIIRFITDAMSEKNVESVMWLSVPANELFTRTFILNCTIKWLRVLIYCLIPYVCALSHLQPRTKICTYLCHIKL